jgi:hypothetical protein
LWRFSLRTFWALFEVGDPDCVVIVGGVCAEMAGDA